MLLLLTSASNHVYTALFDLRVQKFMALHFSVPLWDGVHTSNEPRAHAPKQLSKLEQMQGGHSNMCASPVPSILEWETDIKTILIAMCITNAL